MLALGTYMLGYLVFLQEACLISYRRGLLFYYYCVGLTRAFRLIVDNRARAFFMLVHKAGSCFKELRKIRLLNTFNQLFINNLIIKFYEQKSTYRMCGFVA